MGTRRVSRGWAGVCAVACALLVAGSTWVCAAPRSLYLYQPNGGEVYEIGQSVTITWGWSGNWQADSTVRLEYSSNGGASWSGVPGASAVDYTTGAYSWDTSGCPESTHYRVQVVDNGRTDVWDTSDWDFTVQMHHEPPIITSTPLPNTTWTYAPYRVTASVEDDYGISSVKLFYNRNGLAEQVDMQPSSPNQYYADIPPMARIYDKCCYYIEAADDSPLQNVSRWPAGAPGTPSCFSIISCGSDETGPGSTVMPYGTYCAGNVFYCEVESTLTGVEQYMTISSLTAVSFAVYESSERDAYYTRIFLRATSAEPGSRYYGSGPMSLRLRPGMWYIIGAGAQSGCVHYRDDTTTLPHGGDTAFGTHVSSYAFAYPPLSSVGHSGTNSVAYRQTLTSCRTDYALELVTPNGGGPVIETGATIQCTWKWYGINWLPSDTVRLEYARDGGWSWMQLPGAESLPYNQGSFDWNTWGFPDSTGYMVRVVMNGRSYIQDPSNAHFSIIRHAAPPTIEYWGPSNTHSLGPYTVKAYVSDDHGVESVVLYWSRNGSAFTSVPMIYSGTGTEYAAGIPGPAVARDVFSYYIEATDASYSHNTATLPAGAPADAFCFSILECGTDYVGKTSSYDTSQSGRGNVFEVASPVVLNSFSQRIGQSTQAEKRSYVYESDSRDGIYRKIAENVVAGTYAIPSGPLDVLLVPGRYYVLGLSSGYSTYYSFSELPPQPASFGQALCGNALSTSIPPDTIVEEAAAGIYYQALDICHITSRAVRLGQETDGRYYEPGEVAELYLSAAGPDWQPGDTLRLEYSTDSGATWTPIAGAESLPYTTRAFTWDPPDYPESEHCRLKVTFNGDDSVFDISNADFTVKLDNVPPVIVHAPLLDGGSTNRSPRTTVTDDQGVASVTCFWSKNGSAFTVVPMTLYSSGSSTYYYCSIPGDGVIGDVYQYYFEATDVADTPNTTRSPESGYYDFAIVDMFTEVFAGEVPRHRMDLSYTSVTFTPDGSHSFYSVCTKPIASFPTDPAGGTPLALGDDASIEVALPEPHRVSLFGEDNSSFFVGSNGYVTFGSRDLRSKGYLSYHFGLKRISGLFMDLVPDANSSISWKLLSDRVAVTYTAVPVRYASEPVTFQIEMFFDGRIRLSYLAMAEFYVGQALIVGLSNGYLPEGFTNSDLSDYALCSVGNVEITDSIPSEGDRLMDFGLHTPSTPPRLEYITLRNHGGGDVMLSNLRLGSYVEDFEGGQVNGWQEDSDADWSVVSGRYWAVRDARAPQALISLYTGARFGDLWYEASTAYIAMGRLVFRASPDFRTGEIFTGSGYWFGIDDTCQPLLSVYRQANGSSSLLKRWNPETPLSAECNTLAVDASGGVFDFYANGVLLGTVTDPDPLPPGLVGLMAITNYYPGVNTWFDDVFIGSSASAPPGSTGFALSGVPDLPALLSPGQTLDIDVTYDPPSTGSHSGVVIVDTRGSDEPRAQFELLGGSAEPTAIAQIKQAADGDPVGFEAKCVSAVFADRFYVQEADGASGIGVLWDGTMPGVGDLVTVYGTITASAGEKLIEASSVE